MSAASKPKTWEEYISSHPSAGDLDQQYVGLLKTTFDETDPDPVFRDLEMSPYTIMISFNACTCTIRLTHNHKKIGNKLCGKETIYAALQGHTARASLVIFDHQEFGQSDEISIPAIQLFMAISSETDKITVAPRSP